MHSSTHSDDITNLYFYPNPSSTDPIILSSSSDGLICTSHARESDEEEALAFVGNSGASVAKSGWMSDGQEVWSATDMETLSTWDHEVRTMPSLGLFRS